MTSDFKPEPRKPFLGFFWYNKREEAVMEMEVCYGKNKSLS